MLRKLRYMYYSIILSMILLAGCGQQTRPVSTAQYYNPAKETAADTEEAEGAGAETSIGTDLYLIIGNEFKAACIRKAVSVCLFIVYRLSG